MPKNFTRKQKHFSAVSEPVNFSHAQERNSRHGGHTFNHPSRARDETPASLWLRHRGARCIRGTPLSTALLKLSSNRADYRVIAYSARPGFSCLHTLSTLPTVRFGSIAAPRDRQQSAKSSQSDALSAIKIYSTNIKRSRKL